MSSNRLADEIDRGIAEQAQEQTRRVTAAEIMAASPAVWKQIQSAMMGGTSVMSVQWSGENDTADFPVPVDATPLATTVTTNTTEGHLTLTTTTALGTTCEDWVLYEADRLQGHLLTEPLATTSATNLEWTSVGTIITDLAADARTLHGNLTGFLEDPVDLLPPTADPQLTMESSSPLRAEVFEGDDMGSAYDDTCEQGEAEEWFRDKLRVKP